MDVLDEHVWAAGLTADDVREIRRLKARVERERIPAGEDPQFHLKLGRGSLSDVEWTAQLLQLQPRRAGHRHDGGPRRACWPPASSPAPTTPCWPRRTGSASATRNRLFLVRSMPGARGCAARSERRDRARARLRTRALGHDAHGREPARAATGGGRRRPERPAAASARSRPCRSVPAEAAAIRPERTGHLSARRSGAEEAGQVDDGVSRREGEDRRPCWPDASDEIVRAARFWSGPDQLTDDAAAAASQPGGRSGSRRRPCWWR